MKSKDVNFDLEQAERLELLLDELSKTKMRHGDGPYAILVPESWSQYLSMDYFPQIRRDMTLGQRIRETPEVAAVIVIEEMKSPRAVCIAPN